MPLRYTPERQYAWYDCETRQLLPPTCTEPPPGCDERAWFKLPTCYQPRPFDSLTLKHYDLIGRYYRTAADCDRWCVYANQMQEDRDRAGS